MSKDCELIRGDTIKIKEVKVKSCFRCNEYQGGKCKMPSQVIHRFNFSQIREAEESIWQLAGSCDMYNLAGTPPMGELVSPTPISPQSNL